MLLRGVGAVLLLLLLLLTTVNAQRVTPCFSKDNPPPSCDHGLQGLELYNKFLAEGRLWNTVCNHLSIDFFGLGFNENPVAIGGNIYNKTGFDLEQAWPQALADIPADSEFCSKARSSWSFCEFCGFAVLTPCGFGFDRPTCEDYDPMTASDNSLWTDPELVLSRESSCAMFESSVEDYFQFVIGAAEEDLPQLVQNVSLHHDAMRSMYGFPGQCELLRLAYPHCYWCNEQITDPVTACSYHSLCGASVDTSDQNEVDVSQTCDVIESIVNGDLAQIRLYELDRIRTWDLCERAQYAVPRGCSDVCSGCFNASHPPSCERDENDEETPEKVKAVVELWYMLGRPSKDRSNHMSRLKLLRSTHPICPVFQDVYKYGYWCDDKYAQDETGELFDCGFTTYEYCVGQEFTPFEEENTILIPYNGTDQKEFKEACRTFQDYYAQEIFVLPTIDLCEDQQLYRKACPCVSEDNLAIAEDYLGADTTTKKRALVWVSRASAILSFLGAAYILWDVWKITVGKVRVYHQLLIGMAIFDVVTAVAWSFATFPIDDEDGYSIVGAEGTETTCRVQGFFIQFGLTSIFYNVTLATYYWLIIAKGWKETSLRKVSPFLHGLPIVLGLTLALIGLPYYEGFDYACHLLPYPQGDLWKVLLFVVCPIGCAILLIFVTMFSSYLAMRSMPFDSSKLERLVFWQALFYCLSFCITWPIVLCVYVTGWDFEKEKYGFSIVVAFVAPLQGFNNCLVYVRPKLLKTMQSAARSVAAVSSSSMDSLYGRRSAFRRSYDTDKKSSDTPGESGTNSSTVPNYALAMSSTPTMTMIDPSIAIAEDENDYENPDHYHKTTKEATSAIEGPIEEGDSGQGDGNEEGSVE